MKSKNKFSNTLNNLTKTVEVQRIVSRARVLTKTTTPDRRLRAVITERLALKNKIVTEVCIDPYIERMRAQIVGNLLNTAYVDLDKG